MTNKEKMIDALDYFWSCEDIENMSTDRKHYLKIVLNDISKKYKVNHIYRF